MSQFNTSSYDVERTRGVCAFTGKTLTPGETYVATLVEIQPDADPTSADESAAGKSAPARSAGATPANANASGNGLGLQRVDVCEEAWDEGQRPDHLFSNWQAVVPEPRAKKKLFVDDNVLLNLFERLADEVDPQRIAFRFVLGLILMRKRVFQYETTETRTDAAGVDHEWWVLKRKVSDPLLDMRNPHLNEEQIAAVTEQLGDILEGEL